MRCMLFVAMLLPLLARAKTPHEAILDCPMEYREGMLWVRVNTSKSDVPLNFLLDTGASVSVLNRETAKRLGLKGGLTVSVTGVGGTTEGRWPLRLKADLEGFRLPGAYLAVDLNELGDACRCRVDGLLGADFFRNRVVQLDFAAQRVRVLKTAPADAPGEVLPLDVRRHSFCVPVRVGGGSPAWVRLDTGCAMPLHWVTDEAVPTDAGERVAVALTELTTPTAEADVQVGSLRFERQQISLHRKAIFPGEAGLAGNGLLANFPGVTIDARGRRLMLHSTAPPH